MTKNSCAISSALISSASSRPGRKRSSRNRARRWRSSRSTSLREPDIADRASSETDWSIELRTRDRQRKLIAKIDCAIRRLYEGEYGYCEVTGEPISLARLEARPIATMTLEAQESHERIERVRATTDGLRRGGLGRPRRKGRLLVRVVAGQFVLEL